LRQALLERHAGFLPQVSMGGVEVFAVGFGNGPYPK